MRNKFDQQLEMLHVELIKMGALCEDAVSSAIEALEKNDIVSADSALDTDAEIDHKERDIERMCMKLLLQQQPVATDLRIVSAALKMITDMERVGDQASDIAEISRYIIESGMSINDDIRKMAKEAIKMVTDSVDSFVKKDLELARKVIAYDDVVDEWFAKLKSDVIEMIAKDSTNGEYYIDIIMIAKYLERIGDHATNIAEWVEYSITGVRSKNN
ncbi:phosphate signaling complex protein PhoU [Anaerotignum sp. MSJ-24]|jgi:phosphate transport system protein|uniref:phosphate signaling complex protein PhoU n=1 Tax=Anaerotignum sp. MSJ-24 TaxID=2841521 RepID=UPI001C126AEE|nr:phosphate signaling complex protein PhoU [Anaerotignum sp. MSJ-24]MBU5464596.1 phosphate signaling complex protein PhoU [Anaerotignum sp. MSJ-24]